MSIIYQENKNGDKFIFPMFRFHYAVFSSFNKKEKLALHNISKQEQIQVFRFAIKRVS